MCASVSCFIKKRIIYLFDIDKLHFLQMGVVNCLRNRYIGHNFCCSILLWAFKMFSTAPKRFEFCIILNGLTPSASLKRLSVQLR